MENAAKMNFAGKVAIVTGGGRGIGRAHARLLAARGAKVVVNDYDPSAGGGKTAADQVVDEITAVGGKAISNNDSVEFGDRLVQNAIDCFGRIDVVVNNAGILCDRAFHNMSEDDWDLVYRIHVLGAFRTMKAAWPHMRAQSYGRVVMTSSGSGLFGWFGQSNYAMAKMGLLGFANNLAVEGVSKNIKVNTICPFAGSSLANNYWPASVVSALKPEAVAPLVVYLCHESCPTSGEVFEVGGGWVGRLRWERARGFNSVGKEFFEPEDIASNWSMVTNFVGSTHPESIFESYEKIAELMPEEAANDWRSFIKQLRKK